MPSMNVLNKVVGSVVLYCSMNCSAVVLTELSLLSSDVSVWFSIPA